MSLGICETIARANFCASSAGILVGYTMPFHGFASRRKSRAGSVTWQVEQCDGHLNGLRFPTEAQPRVLGELPKDVWEIAGSKSPSQT